ncbi:MAG: metal ABC transporter permease [Oscillospiraceae bacterium]|nr:metal ABC transporter permease [Oscillospiraceae bacterium]
MIPDIFNYEFMQRAFLVAVLISVIAPCIGVIIVLKRLSAVGDAASHSALAGVAFGLMIGINPVVGAVIFAFLGVMSIELFRRIFGKYAEISTAVTLSAGVGLTALFSGFVKNAANFNSFMFGSIVAISDFEVYLTVGLCAVVITVSATLYRELYYITFDEEAAQIAGVPVKRINFIFMLITAIAVSVASRTVGALMISSLMVIPVACSMIVARSYKQTFMYSIMFAFLFTVSGLFVSYYLDLRPGGSIVIIGVLVLIVTAVVRGNNK